MRPESKKGIEKMAKAAEKVVESTEKVIEAAEKTTETKVKKYEISVESNPTFCGIDAGGVQFANGKAIIPEGRMVEWFKEHAGYAVKECE